MAKCSHCLFTTRRSFFTVLHVSHPGPVSLHLNDTGLFFICWNERVQWWNTWHFKIAIYRCVCVRYRNESACFWTFAELQQQWPAQVAIRGRRCVTSWWGLLKTIMEWKRSLSVIQAKRKHQLYSNQLPTHSESAYGWLSRQKTQAPTGVWSDVGTNGLGS